MDLTYNISDKLKTYLDKIDKLRVQILTYPLSPKNELRLKWDANLERIVWAQALHDSTLSKPEIIRLLSGTLGSKGRLTALEKEVIGLKNAFGYIKENWTVNEAPVSMSLIKKIYEIACKPSLGPATGLTEFSEKKINTFLDYIQKGTDHPVIKAGIAQVEIINITPFDNGNGVAGRLLSYLFLYKNGYDVRELINLEEFYKRDVVTYKRILELGKIQGNLTLWLEYFSYCMGLSLAKALENIKELKFQENIPASFWKLSPRQKQILEYLDAPGAKITNREVQKAHNISQITASRDLAKLTNLGLLLAHGKGRSVFYTKV